MKTYFVLFLCLVLFNCSNSDDTTDEPKTFLELYGGTAWIEADISTTNVYRIIRFVNNTNTPYEDFFYYNEFDCARYYLMTSEYINDYLTLFIVNRIIDNSNQLVLEIIIPSIGHIFVETYTVSGETMTLKQSINGNEETFLFTKYNQNADDLTICD